MTAAVAVSLLATAAAQGTLDASLDAGAARLVAARQAERAAAEAGLAWLAREQQPGGAWLGDVGHKQGDDYLVLVPEAAQRHEASGHVGVTALAGLAFLAGGHVPDRGRYGKVVRAALDYVVRCVGDSGYITDSGTRMYSHAFATLFLAQAHGTVRDRPVRLGLERAVHLITDCQNSLGAWRYNPFATDADLSVTVCQLQALRAARNIGIHVPRATIDRALAYVTASRLREGRDAGLYTYKIHGRGAFTKNREYAVNAAALTSLFSAGVHDPELSEPALRFLADEYPRLAAWYPDHYYFWYGNFYAAQAFWQAGGARSDAFHERIATDLLRRQRSDGRWRNDVGPGDAFATAVACLVLELPMQFLPIFQR